MVKVKLTGGLPDAIQRREILAGNPHYKVDLDELGQKYLEAGRFSDAVDCLERKKNKARLEEIRRIAIERDVFLLTRLAKVEGFTVTPDEWRQAGERALAEGRDRSALVAFERAG